jgi:hypothetical protein
MQYKSTYDYDGLIPAYLSRNYTDGTTAKAMLHFRGKLLYSYNTLVATLRDRFLVITSHDYSVTTSRQLSKLVQAYSGRIIYTEYIFPFKFELVLHEQLTNIESLIKQHTRARKRSYKSEIRTLLSNIEFISTEFNIPLPTRFHELVLINKGLIDR